MKKIIYGLSNFKQIRSEEYLYIDKTRFIEILENRSEKYTLFLRPRRFGKSLFLSTLWHYYDERFSNEFDNLFRETYIGKNPTPLKNSYRVLFLEFSGIEVERGIEVIQEKFTFSLKIRFQHYLKEYGYEKEYIEKLENIKEPESLAREFFEIVKNDKIYLIIDEYDQFANALLSYNMEDFLKIVGKGGFVRSFYEVLKTETMTGTLQKMFITGVTPITLDSLSSGFNIVDNISYHEEFNELAGFTEKEVRLSIKESIAKKCDIDEDAIINQLEMLYDGYKFNLDADNDMYNSTMVNFFLLRFDTKRCKFPEQLLDPNVASDYGAIMRLFRIGNKEKNYKILDELITTGEIKGKLKDRFDLDKGFFEDDFITLIYSMGIITHKRAMFGNKVFCIPNYMMEVLYLNYFAVEIEKRNNIPIQDGATAMVRELALGDMKPFIEKLNDIVKILGNRDYAKFNEKHFQSIVLSLLSFAEFYYIQSEREFNNKYPDIVVTGRKPYDKEIEFNYLFELKWVNKNQPFEIQKEKAIQEIEEYLELDSIKEIENLYAYAVIGSKDGVEFLRVEL